MFKRWRLRRKIRKMKRERNVWFDGFNYAYTRMLHTSGRAMYSLSDYAGVERYYGTHNDFDSGVEAAVLTFLQTQRWMK